MDAAQEPALRYQMAVRDGVEFKRQASDRYVTAKMYISPVNLLRETTLSDTVCRTLTESLKAATIAKLQVTKLDKEMMHFIKSTRKTRAMWFMQTEVDFEEGMDNHSRQAARDIQRMMVRTLTFSTKNW